MYKSRAITNFSRMNIIDVIDMKCIIAIFICDVINLIYMVLYLIFKCIIDIFSVIAKSSSNLVSPLRSLSERSAVAFER